MRDLLTEYDIALVTKPVMDNGDYTYCNEMSNVYSMIDHCMLTCNLQDKCSEVTIIDSVDNMSDPLLLLMLNVSNRYYLC